MISLNIKEEIQKKVTFDIEDLIVRLKNDFGIKNKNTDKIEEALFDTLNIILNTIHQRKLPKDLYTVWYRMTKDYWDLNGYSKYSNNEDDQSSDSNKQIKSITVGDTTTTFADNSTQVKISGVTYNTGTVDFDEDILVKKYKKELYNFRKLRW